MLLYSTKNITQEAIKTISYYRVVFFKAFQTTICITNFRKFMNVSVAASTE